MVQDDVGDAKVIPLIPLHVDKGTIEAHRTSMTMMSSQSIGSRHDQFGTIICDCEELSELDENETGLIILKNNKDGGIDDFPESSHEGELVEAMLADEISKLSLLEHEKIMFDVHGIQNTDQEDPEDVDKLLEEVEATIGAIRRKPAYERAKYLNQKYVEHRSFRLMFLRCDRFDIKLASQRIVRHFEVKERLFGSGEILGRDICLSDFSEEDMMALEAGFIQVLPSRDAAGRSIFSVAPMYRPESCSTESCGRAMWYMLNTTMKDEEAQRKGMVGILSNFGLNARKEPPALVAQLHRMRSGLPKKICGFHYCYDDKSLKPFVAGMKLFLSKEMRTRFRPHFGNEETIAFELQTFGIPTNEHPLLQGNNGALSLEWHRQWLEVRKTQEESESSKDGSIIPRRFDVLFGRGRDVREHTGNLRAAHLVEMHQPEYEQAGKFGKTEIAERIVNMIQESLGRFLKWDRKEGWVEVDHDAAREKISHYFRHLRSKKHSTASDDSSSARSNNVDGSSDQSSSTVGKRVTPCASPIHSTPEETTHPSGKSAKYLVEDIQEVGEEEEEEQEAV